MRRNSSARPLPPGAQDFATWKKIFEVTAALDGESSFNAIRVLKFVWDGRPRFWRRRPGWLVGIYFDKHKGAPCLCLEIDYGGSGPFGWNSGS